MVDKVNWKVGGEAGLGIISSGTMFSRILGKAGLSVFGYQEYPSLIRGGHNTFHVSAGIKEIRSPHFPLDVLVALNENTISRNSNELSLDGIIIYNEDRVKEKPSNANYLPIPLNKIAKEAGGDEVMANTVAIGASAAYFGIEEGIIKDTVASVFSGKNPDLAEKNQKAANLGYSYFKEKLILQKQISKNNVNTERLILTGNEALALGCIAAGCQFSAIYPMTPITNILHYLINHQDKLNMIIHQSEDEIAGINMALGASFAGLRSMVATSGGGFDLMTEALSFSGISETPLVIIEGQRGGPSTGLPTWTAQADLEAALYSGHGEFPRLLFAPGDAREAILMTIDAFNLSEMLQIPAIILVDKHLCESVYTCLKTEIKDINIDRGNLLFKSEIGTEYKRYSLIDSIISKRAFPGTTEVVVRSNSYEHTEEGFSTEDPNTINKMQNKRMGKMKLLESSLPDQKIYGDENADTLIVGWGSTKGVILDAMDLLEEENIKVRFLHVNRIWPFPRNQIETVINKARRTIIFENNCTMQLAKLIRQETGIAIDNRIPKYDGRPFLSEEIVSKVKKII